MNKIIKIKRCCDCNYVIKESQSHRNVTTDSLYCQLLIRNVNTYLKQCLIINRKIIKKNCPLKKYKRNNKCGY